VLFSYHGGDCHAKFKYYSVNDEYSKKFNTAYIYRNINIPTIILHHQKTTKNKNLYFRISINKQTHKLFLLEKGLAKRKPTNMMNATINAIIKIPAP
jgi:hypothetical protein